MAQRFLYLREYTTKSRNGQEQMLRGNLVGCLAVEVNRKSNTIKYGFSVCSPIDIFDKSRARQIASIRLEKKPNVIDIEVPESSHDITQAIMNHLSESNSLQTKNKKRSVIAYESAQGWLRFTNLPQTNKIAQ